jgi:hypothetical protein
MGWDLHSFAGVSVRVVVRGSTRSTSIHEGLAKFVRDVQRVYGSLPGVNRVYRSLSAVVIAAIPYATQAARVALANVIRTITRR